MEQRATVEDVDLRPLPAKGFTLSGKTFVPGSSSPTLVLYPEEPSSPPSLEIMEIQIFMWNPPVLKQWLLFCFPNVPAEPNTSPGWMVSVASSGGPCHRPVAQMLVEEKFQTAQGQPAHCFIGLCILCHKRCIGKPEEGEISAGWSGLETLFSNTM